MHIGILKNTGSFLAFHSVFGIATEVTKGTRRCMLQKLTKNRLCLRPPLMTVSLLHLPCLRLRRLRKL